MTRVINIIVTIIIAGAFKRITSARNKLELRLKLRNKMNKVVYQKMAGNKTRKIKKKSKIQ